MTSSFLRWLAVCLLLPLALVALSPHVAAATLRASQPSPIAVPRAASSQSAKANLSYVEVTDGIEDPLLGRTLDADLLALRHPLNVTLDGGTTTYTLPAGSLVLFNAGAENARGTYGWWSSPQHQLGQQWTRFQVDNAGISNQAEVVSCSLAEPLTAYAFIAGWVGENLLTVSRNLSHWQAVDGNTSAISQYTSSSCQVDSDGCLRFFFGEGLDNHYPYPNNFNPHSWKGCLTKDGGMQWTHMGNNTLAPLYDVSTGVHRRNPHLDGRDVFYAIDGQRLIYEPKVNASGLYTLYHVSVSLDTAHWYTLMSDVPWNNSFVLQEVMAVSETGIISFSDSAHGVWASVDGGLTFGRCSGAPEYGQRAAASTAFDLSGRQFVVGGVGPRNQPDVWRSNVVWTDLKSVTYYCDVTAPEDGIPGLRQWPPAVKEHIGPQGE